MSLYRVRSIGLLVVSLAGIVAVSTACGMAGFGGALTLNITDRQTRELTIELDGGAPDARLLEVGTNGEVQIGTGTTTIDRYVLQRATFGQGVAVGYFLCPKPCRDPLSSYVVAYSPDQIFNADGRLELHFRVVAADGTAEDLTRLINGEMLPTLWAEPKIEAVAGGN